MRAPHQENPFNALPPVVVVLALGKMVAEVFAAWAVLVVFFGSSIFGALVYLLIVPVNSPLIGAYTFILWVYLRAVGQQQAQAFTLIGFLMGIQLLFSLFPGSPPDWIADLSGFAAGFGLSVLVSPGGFQRLMAKFRQR